MDATTVANGLPEDVFELACSDAHDRIVECKQLPRSALSRCLANRQPLHAVCLLSSRDVRPFVAWVRPQAAPRDFVDVCRRLSQVRFAYLGYGLITIMASGMNPIRGISMKSQPITIPIFEVA